MSVRLAVVQPLAVLPPDDEANVAAAVKTVAEAAQLGADFVLFPETYPGPWRTPLAYDPTEAMTDAARRHGVYVQFGTLEAIPGEEEAAYNVLRLATPDGEYGSYRRTHPPGPWIYKGGDKWDFNYVAGDELHVFPTPHGVVGLAMCSEVYMPEICRALALRGAELIFLPAGVDKRRLWDTWRQLIWARAIENLAVVVTTQNVFDQNERGLAMVAAPESVLLEATGPGMYLVDVDLERARQLRAGTDDWNSSHEAAAKEGVLTQWQRPELWGAMFDR